MNRKMRRFFSIVLVACMLFSLAPLHATEYFEDSETISSEELQEGSEFDAKNDEVNVQEKLNLESNVDENKRKISMGNMDAENLLESTREMLISDKKKIKLENNYGEQNKNTISAYAADENNFPSVMPDYNDIAIIFVCTKNNQYYDLDSHTKYISAQNGYGTYWHFGEIIKSDIPQYEYMCEFILDAKKSMDLYRRNTSSNHSLLSLAYGTSYYDDSLDFTKHFYFYWDGEKWIFPYLNAIQNEGYVTNYNYAIFAITTELNELTDYTIVREYYVNDEMIATVTSGDNQAYLEDIIYADVLFENNAEWRYRNVDGNRIEFDYLQDEDNNIIITASDNVITLKFIKKQKIRVKFETIDEIETPEEFYMEYFFDDDLKTIQGVLKLSDAIKIEGEDNLYEWEMVFPSNKDVTFKGYNFMVYKYNFIGIDSISYVVKEDKKAPSITLRNPYGLTPLRIQYLYNYVGETVDYRVEWYDKQGNTLKGTSYRSNFENVVVNPENNDYIIDGWVFDEHDRRNILSKELKTDEVNVLKLYFYKFIPAVNLNFEKNIDRKSDSFEKLKLNKDESYNFFISLTNQETGEVINGMLDSKDGFRVNNVPIGTYIIEEQNDIWFSFVSMALMEPIEGIEFKEENGAYIITIGATVESGATANIEITNKPDEERFYDSKYDIKNLFTPTM